MHLNQQALHAWLFKERMNGYRLNQSTGLIVTLSKYCSQPHILFFMYCKSFQSYLELWKSKGKLGKTIRLECLSKATQFDLHIFYGPYKCSLLVKNKSSIMVKSTALEWNCLYWIFGLSLLSCVSLANIFCSLCFDSLICVVVRIIIPTL